MIITAFSRNYKKSIDFHIKFYIISIFIPSTIPLMAVIIAFSIGNINYVNEISAFMGNLFSLEINNEKWIWVIIASALIINTLKLRSQIKNRKINTLQTIQIMCDLIENGGVSNEAIRMLSYRKYPKNITTN